MTDDVPPIFWEIHTGLPREGPGDDESTRKAFRLAGDLPARPRILDIGCGPGAQTIALARISGGTITAIDTHQPFLDELARRAKEGGLADRIAPLNASMFALPFEPESFDLIWSEGAIYFLGFRAGLDQWRQFLTARGYLAVTEPCWLRADIPKEVGEFWAGYPGMSAIEDNLSVIAASGYEHVGHFLLPEASWWAGYYTPMERRIETLREKYKDDLAALAEIAESQAEIDMYRAHADHYGSTYGYAFFVMRKLP